MKRIWNDQVWSKVIAGIILAIIGSIYSAFIYEDNHSENKIKTPEISTPHITITKKPHIEMPLNKNIKTRNRETILNTCDTQDPNIKCLWK